jgi:hypothetical protein
MLEKVATCAPVTRFLTVQEMCRLLIGCEYSRRICNKRLFSKQPPITEVTSQARTSCRMPNFAKKPSEVHQKVTLGALRSPERYGKLSGNFNLKSSLVSTGLPSRFHCPGCRSLYANSIADAIELLQKDLARRSAGGSGVLEFRRKE